MADVLVLFGHRPDIPMKVEPRHLDAIQAACSGKVYYYQSEEEALADGVDAEVLFIWGGSGKMPAPPEYNPGCFCRKSAGRRASLDHCRPQKSDHRGGGGRRTENL